MASFPPYQKSGKKPEELFPVLDTELNIENCSLKVANIFFSSGNATALNLEFTFVSWLIVAFNNISNSVAIECAFLSEEAASFCSIWLRIGSTI